MSEHQAARERPVGETSGSPQRPPHRLIAAGLTFDLDAELDRLRREESYRGGDRNARTLVSQPDFRIVLTAMKAGARLREHQTPAPVSIQTIAGRLRLHLSDREVDLPTGHLLVLDRDVRHDVEALDESAFLLTVRWAGAQEASG